MTVCLRQPWRAAAGLVHLCTWFASRAWVQPSSTAGPPVRCSGRGHDCDSVQLGLCAEKLLRRSLRDQVPTLGRPSSQRLGGSATGPLYSCTAFAETKTKHAPCPSASYSCHVQNEQSGNSCFSRNLQRATWGCASTRGTLCVLGVQGLGAARWWLCFFLVYSDATEKLQPFSGDSVQNSNTASA